MAISPTTRLDTSLRPQALSLRSMSSTIAAIESEGRGRLLADSASPALQLLAVEALAAAVALDDHHGAVAQPPLALKVEATLGASSAVGAGSGSAVAMFHDIGVAVSTTGAGHQDCRALLGGSALALGCRGEYSTARGSTATLLVHSVLGSCPPPDASRAQSRRVCARLAPGARAHAHCARVTHRARPVVSALSDAVVVNYPQCALLVVDSVEKSAGPPVACALIT